MGWGGARVGAGRKPTRRHSAAPRSPFAGVGASSGPQPASTDDDSSPDLAEPPKDLPVDQQAFWREQAIRAIERKTLTAATVPAFRLLCELHAKKEKLSAIVERDGKLGTYRVFAQLAKQVEGLMGRFCLAPFGKPVDPGSGKRPGANAWSVFNQPARK